MEDALGMTDTFQSITNSVQSIAIINIIGELEPQQILHLRLIVVVYDDDVVDTVFVQFPYHIGANETSSTCYNITHLRFRFLFLSLEYKRLDYSV